MELVFVARGSKLSGPEFVGLEGLGWLLPGVTILQPFLQWRRTEVVFERHIELEVVMLVFSMFAGADVEASLRRNLTQDDLFAGRSFRKNEYGHKAQNTLLVAALLVKFGKFGYQGLNVGLGKTRSEMIISI